MTFDCAFQEHDTRMRMFQKSLQTFQVWENLGNSKKKCNFYLSVPDCKKKKSNENSNNV
jgi:hypothetical protein